MRRSFRTWQAGITLVEVMIAGATSSVLAGGMLLALNTVQRSFRASEHYVNRQTEQLRVTDYMALDLRRALTVTTVDERLRMTIPEYYHIANDGQKTPREPTISRGQVDYGSAPISIAYYKEGDKIYREEAGTRLTLAEDVEDMAIDYEDLDDVIEVRVNFSPKYQFSGATAGDRAATTAYTRVLLRNKRRN